MKKVASGEPLNRSAGDWNRLVDLANNSPQQSPGGVFSRRFGPGVDPGDKHNRVRVKNGSGAARRRGEVLQLDDQLTAVLDPAYVGLLGGKPAAGYHCFGILQGDVPADEIGVAAVSGATLAQVCFYDVNHRFAAVQPGSCLLRSVASGPIPILSPAPDGICKHEVLVLLPNSCFEEPTTTTTEESPLEEPTCTGGCKFVASASLEWVQVSNTCAIATTTTAAETTTTPGATTTTGEAGTSTTAGPTTTTTPCCCEAEAEPGTTTTVACDCLWPTFCPSAAGECTYTFCVHGAGNVEPYCVPTTTTAPATTTTCDCGSVTPPTPCALGCDWVGLPSGAGGVWVWHQTSNGCAATCPCPAPDGDPTCATAHTDCVLEPPPPPPPGPAACEGLCTWVYVAALGKFYRTSSACSAVPGCHCQPPSSVECDFADCCPVSTPCVTPPVDPATSTTQAYQPCQYQCYGGSPGSTTTAPATTTTPSCETGGCKFASNGDASGWIGPSGSTCPGDCPCVAPSRLPYDTCEVVYVGCHGDPPTTTTVPATTTTPSCETGGCKFASNGDASGWIGPSGSTCPGDCPCVAPSWLPYDTREVVYVGCHGDPPTTTTVPATTTTAQETTTTAGPTTTTSPPETTTTPDCPSPEPCHMTWRCEDGEWVGCNDACGTNGAGEPPPLPCTQWDVYDGYCGNLFGGCPPTTTTGPATTTTSACTPARCVYECQGTSWVQIVSCAGCTCSDDSSVGMPCIESDPNLEFDCVP